MTKQEKISEAWGIHYASDVDEIGFRKYSEWDKYLLYQWDDKYFEKAFNEITKEWCVRPKCLKGIEDNNGWIRINQKVDLPKKYGEYYVINKVGNIYISTLYDSVGLWDYVRYNNVTHYQPIEKPQPPIY